jgi:hypothetical protein
VETLKTVFLLQKEVPSGKLYLTNSKTDQLSGQNVWITWVGERLGILAGEGLYIPILEEVEGLSEKYYENELREYES